MKTSDRERTERAEVARLERCLRAAEDRYSRTARLGEMILNLPEDASPYWRERADGSAGWFCTCGLPPFDRIVPEQFDTPEAAIREMYRKGGKPTPTEPDSERASDRE